VKCRAPLGRSAEIFYGSTIGPGPRKRSRPCQLLGSDGAAVGVLRFRHSFRLFMLG